MPCSRVSVTTAATMSPTNSTRSAAICGRSNTGSMGNPAVAGSPMLAPVYTASTPSMASASLVSTDSMAAWAIGERTNVT